jgi:hypothetical protein
MNQQFPIAEIESELAYDALLDGLSLVSRLIQSPCTLEQLADEFPDVPSMEELERQLHRLVRSGIVKKEGNVYQVTAPFFLAHRQGGQLDLLNEMFLPALLGVVAEGAEGLLLPIHLHLRQEEQKELFAQEVTPLLQELSRVADESGECGPDRYVFIAGTPDFPREPIGFDLALEIVRNAARNRADPARRDRSIITYFQARLDSAADIHRSLLQFEQKFESRKAPPSEANYVLLLGAGMKTPKGTFK